MRVVSSQGSAARLRRRAQLLLVLVGAGAAACQDGEPGIQYTGAPGTPVEAFFDGLVATVRVGLEIDGQSYPDKAFVIDTGAPLTILDTGTFPGLADGKHAAALDALAVQVPQWTVVSWDLPGDHPGVFDGLLGGDLLRHFALTLDYQGGRAWLSDPFEPDALPGDVALAELAAVPIQITGGGYGSLPGDCPGGCGTIEVPPTRVVLRARFEAQADPAWVLLDTGASAVVLTSTLLEELDAATPGRPRLEGVTVSTVYDDETAYLSRVYRLGLASPAGEASTLTFDDLPVLVIPGDELLANVSVELGRDVRALVGGTALRSFLTTVDYQAEALVLGRYREAPDTTADYVGVGFAMEQAASGEWQVTDVYANTDAAAEGLTRGDVITQLGSSEITGRSALVVGALLGAYQLGDEVPVSLARAPLQQLLVSIEDLLPSFPPP